MSTALPIGMLSSGILTVAQTFEAGSVKCKANMTNCVESLRHCVLTYWGELSIAKMPEVCTLALKLVCRITCRPSQGSAFWTVASDMEVQKLHISASLLYRVVG